MTSPSEEPLIEAIELTKSFGGFPAVRSVSFSVERGQAVGFVGPNGAGKTTTFRMLAGTLGPSSGRVRISGQDLEAEPEKAKRALGYMPEAPLLYPEMTPREYLRFRAALKDIARKKLADALDPVIEQTHIGDVLATPIGHLSKGYRQRVALADALLGDPPVLLLDEPTSGLDPNQVLEFRSLIRKLAEERTILLSTHVLSEVEATCQTALVIHRGQLVASGSLGELKAQTTQNRARLLVRTSRAEVERALAGARLQLREIREEESSRIDLLVAKAEDDPDETSAHQLIERALPLLHTAGITVLEATPVSAALDQVFSELTNQALTHDTQREAGS